MGRSVGGEVFHTAERNLTSFCMGVSADCEERRHRLCTDVPQYDRTVPGFDIVWRSERCVPQLRYRWRACRSEQTEAGYRVAGQVSGCPEPGPYELEKARGRPDVSGLPARRGCPVRSLSSAANVEWHSCPCAEVPRETTRRGPDHLVGASGIRCFDPLRERNAIVLWLWLSPNEREGHCAPCKARNSQQKFPPFAHGGRVCPRSRVSNSRGIPVERAN